MTGGGQSRNGGGRSGLSETDVPLSKHDQGKQDLWDPDGTRLGRAWKRKADEALLLVAFSATASSVTSCAFFLPSPSSRYYFIDANLPLNCPAAGRAAAVGNVQYHSAFDSPVRYTSTV